MGLPQRLYGLESLEPIEGLSSSLVLLTLKGTYDVRLLSELYAQLPGIESAEADGTIGDGPTICAARSDSEIESVVDDAGGDCPAGCTTHEAHRFRSTAAGEVETLEQWSSESGEPAPDWFPRVCAP